MSWLCDYLSSAVRPCRWFGLFLLIALYMLLGTTNQRVYAQSCTGDQPDAPAQINCTANDVEIAEVVVLNGVTQCVTGEMVTLDLAVDLTLNANQRYDIGIYTALDGGDAVHGVCSFDDFPTTSPFKQLEGAGADSCGDINGPVDNYPIRTLTTQCIAGPDGRLLLNSLVLWEQNRGNSCSKVPGSPAKCNMQSLPVDVTVVAPITVTKSAAPADGTDFNFTVISGTDTLENFALDHEATNRDAVSQRQVVLAPIGKSVTLREQVPTGWELTSVVCNGQTMTVENNAVTLTADADGLACLVTNQKSARILVQKATIPEDDATGFDFTLNGGPDNLQQTFSLRGGEVYTSGFTLTPGAGYSVAETGIPADWTQNSATCSSDQQAGSLDPAAIALAAGETVTCRFVNRRIPKGSITIRKLTDPTDVAATFAFTTANLTPSSFTLVHGASRLFADLPTGVYQIGEGVAAGWQLTGITCTGQSNSQVQTSGNQVRINLALSENVVCTFTNDPLPSISLSKTATPNQIPESGADVTYEFVVTNNRNEPVTLTSLSDNRLGELTNASVSDCQDNAIVPANSTYTCSATVWLSGDVPATHTNTATATVQDDEGNPATAQANATVTFADVLPTIAVEKSATPGSLSEPGGSALFTFTVTNSGQETVTVTSLTDSVFGNLVGQGSCATGSALPPGDSYTCAVTKTIARNFSAGDHQNTVTAAAQDDEGNSATDTDDEIIAITDTPAALTVEKLASPATVGEPGGLVTYTVVITNNSPVDNVTITQVVDRRPGNQMVDVSNHCALPRTLAVNQSMTCTFSYTVTGVSSDLHTNTITVSGSDDDGEPLRESATATVAILNTPSALALSKTASVTSLPEPGGNVTFTAVITNLSIADVVTVTTLTDDLYGDLSLDCALPRVLAAGEAFTCAFVRNVSGNAGENHHNTLVVAGVDDDGDAPSATDDAAVTISDLPASLAISKDANPTSVPETGGLVNFTVQITNTSSADAIDLHTLIDSVYGNVAGTCLPTTLAPGATTTCSFSRFVAGEAGVDHVNTVTVSGADDDGNALSGQDDATVTLQEVLPQLAVSKAANPTTIPETGGTVTFTFVITNTGAETLILDALTDSVFGDLDGMGTCMVGSGKELAPNAAYTCTMTTWLTGDAPNSHNNTVTAQGHDNDGNSTSDTASASVTYSDSLPTITISKSASRLFVTEPGSTVVFTFTVTNRGDEAVTLTDLTDSVFGDLDGQGSCATGITIAPSASSTCTISRWLGTNYADGDHANTVTATAEDDEGNPATATDDATVTLLNSPSSIRVSKVANRNTVFAPGATVTFTLAVTNSSVVDSVTITQVIDARTGSAYGANSVDVSALCTLPRTLLPGDSFTCQFTDFVPGAVGDSYQNTVTVTGTDDDGDDVTGQASAFVNVGDSTGLLTVAKLVTPTTLTEPGGVVTFTVVITNQSADETIVVTSLQDTIFGDLTGLCTLPQSLAPQSNHTCTFARTLTGAANSPHHNTVTVLGETGFGDPLSALDDATVTFRDQFPTVVAEKQASVTTLPELGANVTFTITGRNALASSDVITVEQVIDSVYGDVSSSCIPSLPIRLTPGQSFQCVFIRFVQGAPGTQHRNQANLYGVDDDNGTFTTTSPEVVIPFTPVAPQVSVAKSANPAAIDESGGLVTFQVVITNTGQETATLTNLNDSVFGNLDSQGDCATGGSLTPGAIYACSFSKWLAGTPSAPHNNIVTATLTDDDNVSATDTDDATVTFTDLPPTIQVSKRATPNVINEPGDVVTFTFMVENSSAETLTLTTLTDSVFGNLDGQGDCATGGAIAPGATSTCTLVQTISQNFADGDHQNTVTATAADDENNSVTDSATATVTVNDLPATIQATKTASVNTLGEPGGLVTYTVVITNSSLVDSVTITQVVDSRPSGIVDVSGDCNLPRTLTAGQSFICTFNYTVTGNSGALHQNTITVSGSDDDSEPVNATATETVALLNTPSALALRKTASVTTLPEPGGPVTFTAVITNLSAADVVTVTTLTDDLYGNLAAVCGLPRALTPGAAFTCDFVHTVTGNAGDRHHNTLIVRGTDQDGDTPSATDDAEITFSDLPASLAVSKTANPTSVPESGGMVNFTVRITNTSSADDVAVQSLIDSVYGNVAGTCLPTTLAPGASTICIFNRFVGGETGVDHVNTAIASGTDDDGNALSAQDDATVTLLDVQPQVNISKSANPITIPESGGVVTFTFGITNTSSEALVLDALTDSVFGNLDGQGDCLLGPDGKTLAPGASYTCAITQWLLGDAPDSHNNTVTVQAHDNDGNSTAAFAAATVVYTDALPSITVDKAAAPFAMTEPGGAAHFTFTVTNNGTESVTLTDLNDSVFGNLGGQGNCPTSGVIAPGDSLVCTIAQILTVNYADGDHVNTVTATVSDDDGNSDSATDDATITWIDTPSAIQVAKLASRDTVVVPGGDVTFTVYVTNTSLVDSVTITQMVDTRYSAFVDTTVDVSNDCSLARTLAPGASFSCQFTDYIGHDVIGETYRNTVTVSGSDDDGNPVSGRAKAVVTVVDGLNFMTIDKTASPTTLNEPGGEVVFTVTITNTNPGENITITALDDTVFGDLSTVCGLPLTIFSAMNPVVTCVFTETVSGPANALHENTVTAVGITSVTANTVSASDDATVTITDRAPTITAQKAASVVDLPEVGANVIFTITGYNSIISSDVITVERVIDNVFGDVSASCTPSLPARLNPGQNVQCVFTRFLQGSPTTQHSNQATLYGIDDDNVRFTTPTNQVDIPFTPVIPAISVSKTAIPATVVETGGAVTFQVVITNTGQETATLTNLNDSIFGNLDGQGNCAIGASLPPGGVYHCAFTEWLTGSPSTPHQNTLTAAIADDDGSAVIDSDDATVTFTDLLPTINVGKRAAPKVISEPGGVVTFTFTVENSSEEAVILTSLTDTVLGDLDGQGSCSIGGTLPPAAIYTCAVSTPLTRNFAAGNHQNTVTATAEDDENNSVTDTATASITVRDVPATMQVAKTASVNTLDEPGGLVTYTVAITNSSLVDSVTITQVVDLRPGGSVNVSSNCGLPQTLAAGQSLLCTFSYTVTGNSGALHQNTVTVSGSDDDGEPINASDTETVAILNSASALALSKTASVTSLSEPGGNVTFTAVITNLSAADVVTVTTLIDDLYGDLEGDCGLPRVLTAGTVFTCTFVRAVTGNGGDQHQNTLIAEGVDDDGNGVSAVDTATVTISDLPAALVVSKEANPTSVDESGALVDFTVRITNTSATDAIELQSLIDSVYGDVTGACPVTTLAAGATVTCTFSRFVNGEAGNNHVNTVTASGVDDDDNAVSAQDTATVTIQDLLPQLAVSKTVNRTSVPETGGNVTFSFVITNTGAEAITLDALTDSVFGDLDGQGSCVIGSGVTLAPNATYTCAMTAWLQGDAPGSHSNTVTAQAHDNDGNNTTDTASASVTYSDSLPAVTVTKAASQYIVAEPGGTLLFTFTVTNSGQETVTLTSLTDSVFGNLDGQGNCATGITLAPGADTTCTVARLIGSNYGNGDHTNTVTATVSDDEGNTDSAIDDAAVIVSNSPSSIQVTKVADRTTIAPPGGNVTFTLLITNSSLVDDVTITQVVDARSSPALGNTVVDVSAACALPRTLWPGQAFQCQFSDAVTGVLGDLYQNTVTVTGTDDDGDSVTAQDQATVGLIASTGLLLLEKVAIPAAMNEPGGVVTFTVTITNPTVAESVTITALHDSVFGDLATVCGLPLVINPTIRSAATCTFTRTLNGAANSPHHNTVTALGQTASLVPLAGFAEATVAFLEQAPTIVAVKVADASAVAELGALVTFTITSRNALTSSDVITVERMIDTVFGDISSSCMPSLPARLVPGAAVQCVFSRWVQGTPGTNHVDSVLVQGVDDDNHGFIVSTNEVTIPLTPVNPQVSVNKTAIPETVAETGGAVTFQVVITNTGQETATLTSLSDNLYGDLDGQGDCVVGATLAPGETYRCTFSQWLTGSPSANHRNTVTAILTDDDNTPVSGSDNAVVTFTDVLPAISVSKNAAPNLISEPGGVVTFTFTVENRSAETLTVTTLVDNVLGDLNGQGSCATGHTLAPGATYTCMVSTTITRNFAAGNHQNTVTATAQDDENNSVSDSATATVVVSDVPANVQVTKTPSVDTVDEPGGVVTYTVVITNSSLVDSVTITRVLDTRPGVGAVDVSSNCNLPSTLAAGSSMSCTFSYFVSGNSGDLHSNSLLVEGSDDDSDPIQETTSATVAILNTNSALQVRKIAGVATLAEPGGTVAFTVIVTNVSPSDLITITQLTDSVFGDVGTSCVGANLPRRLLAGEVFSCTFQGNITGNADDQHQNTLMVEGVDDDGDDVAAVDQALVDLTDLPATLAVSKQASRTSVPENGENVDFTVVLTNTSQADAITIESVVDSVFGDVSDSCLSTLPQTLMPGATLTCQFSRAIAGDFGTMHSNLVTATGFDDDNHPITQSAGATVTISDTPPLLQVDKVADPATVAESGDVVEYLVLVENDSVADTITVTAPILDNRFGDITDDCMVDLPVVLLPGEGFHCRFNRLVQGDIESNHTNLIVVNGVGDDGDAVQGSDSETVDFTDEPSGLVVSKTPSAPGVPKAGGVITFTIQVLNSSAADSVQLTALDDSVYGNVADPANTLVLSSDCRLPQTLAVGGLYECHFSALIRGPIGMVHRNLITVTGQDDDGTTVTAQDDATVTVTDPLLWATKRDLILKDTNLDHVANPGETIRYSIVLRNDGNATAEEAVINDLPHYATTLVNGTVTTTHGTVVIGNGAGETTIRIAVGALAPNAEVVVSFDVKVNEPLPLGVTEVRNQALISGSNFAALSSDDPDTPTPDDATATPVSAAPILRAAKTDELVIDADNNGYPSPGDTLEYRLLIVNVGNQDGIGVLANDLLDPNLTLLLGSVTTSQGTVVSGNQPGDTTVRVELGVVRGSTVVAPGPEVIVRFRVLVRNPLAVEALTVANQALVSAENYVGIPTDDPSTDALNDPTSTSLTLTPELEASKRVAHLVDADGDQFISPGDTVFYQVTLVNHGNGRLNGLVFTDTPDANTTLIAGTVQSSRGEVVLGNNSGDRSIEITIGSLAAQGGRVTISYQARINGSLPPAVTQVTNQGVIRSLEMGLTLTDDPTLPGREDRTAAPVVATPNLMMVKEWTLIEDSVPDWSKPGDVTVGDTLLYRLTILNTGNGVTAPLIFDDQPDAATTLVAGTVATTQGQVLVGNNAGDRAIRIDLGRIAPGERVQISYRVRISNGGVAEIENQASLVAPGEPQTPPLYSDNPATPVHADPTKTRVITGPTAEQSPAEPVAPGDKRVYLPVVAR